MHRRNGNENKRKRFVSRSIGWKEGRKGEKGEKGSEGSEGREGREGRKSRKGWTGAYAKKTTEVRKSFEGRITRRKEGKERTRRKDGRKKEKEEKEE